MSLAYTTKKDNAALALERGIITPGTLVVVNEEGSTSLCYAVDDTNLIDINSSGGTKKGNEASFAGYVALDGEILFVATPNGLRMKVGDGASVYEDLPWFDEALAQNIIIKGYYYNDKFYADEEHTSELVSSGNKIYIDKSTDAVYYIPNGSFVKLTASVEEASEETAGIMKLYKSAGSNEDGSMTQKAITEALASKYDITADDTEETLNFSIN